MSVKKLYNKMETAAMGCVSSIQRCGMALALFLIASVNTFAQNAAGDYSAGTTALSEVAQEIILWLF